MPFNLEFALKILARWNGTAGTAWDAPSNLERFNSARRLIYDRANDWIGTVDWITIAIGRGDGRLVLPEPYEVIRIAYAGSKMPVRVAGLWHNVIDRDEALRIVVRDGSRAVPIVLTDDSNERPYHTKPQCRFTFTAIPEFDEPGKEISFTVKNRSTEKTESLPLDSQQGASFDGYVDDILTASKPRTSGYVRVWGQEAGSKSRILMAQYGPDIEEPSYRSYSICSPCESCQCVVALVKKKFIPINNLKHRVDINSIDALKHAYIAINKQEEGDFAGEAQNIDLIGNYMDRTDRELTEGEPSASLNMNSDFTSIGIGVYD